MIRKTAILLFTSYLLTSCVAHKDIVYFQGQPQQKSKINEVINQPYHLQTDDILHIDLKAADENLVSVFQNNVTPQSNSQINMGNIYFNGYSIDKEGFISIPYLGKINVLGLTTDEVSEKIKGGLSKFFKDTSGIFVQVKLAGFKYTIIGEVGSTGTKILYQNSVNIIEAIANAGDINITGNKRTVEILRPTVDGVDKYVVDLTHIGVFNAEMFYLQPNDIINVPPLRQKSYGTGTTGVQTLTTVISVLSLVTTTFLLFKNI
jgi:polysaccharide export outer membrane protein